MTAEDVESLREFLVEDDSDTFLNTETGTTTLVGGVLLNAAFGVLVRRKFSPTYTVPQIIRYVTDLRMKLAESGLSINPRVAEGMIRDVLGDKQLKDREPYGADAESLVIAGVTILTDLFEAAALDGPEMERFLQDSAEYARQWLDAHRAASGVG
ncbi:hypothetical protein ACN3XK_52175 [Actinomadura welshii]